jgi:hypothetical protein
MPVDVVAKLISTSSIEVKRFAQASFDFGTGVNTDFAANCTLTLDLFPGNTGDTVTTITKGIKDCFFTTDGKYDENSVTVAARATMFYNNLLKPQLTKYDTFIITDHTNAAAGYLKTLIADERYKPLITLTYANGGDSDAETMYTEEMFLKQIKHIHGDMQGRISVAAVDKSETYKFYINQIITLSGETAAYKALVQALYLTNGGDIVVKASMPLTNDIELSFD